MCYDVATQLRKKVKQAEHKGAPNEEIEYIKKKLDKFVDDYGEAELASNEHHWTMGFQHQNVPVITNELPEEIQFFQWGLIPSWVKNIQEAKDISSKCLNARSETIFEKPSFRFAAQEKRCIIPLSGYFEHHWLDKSGKQKVPYFIQNNNGKPLYMAGLWEVWVNKETGEELKSCAFVTTNANEKLSQVHNRKPNDPRMLAILDFENITKWLGNVEGKADQNLLQETLAPYPTDRLVIYPVSQLRGKNGIGNVPEVTEPFHYNFIGLP